MWTTIKSFTEADLKLINDFKTQGGEAAIKLNGKDLQLSAWQERRCVVY
jgi:hypothetical protein